jgi:hypothetical protein
MSKPLVSFYDYQKLTHAPYNAVTEEIARYVDPKDMYWSATNPSIGHSPKKGYAVAIRSSNYYIAPNGTYTVTHGTGQIKNRVWFAELDKQFKLKNLRQIDFSKLNIKLDRGMEDPKLFWRDGAWHFTCVMMEKDICEVARMATCRLDAKAEKVIHMEKFSGIEVKRPEKNWMLSPEPNPHFDFIYGPNAIVKNGVLTTLMSDNETLHALRGNTNLIDLKDSTYIGIMHRTIGKQTTVRENNSFGNVNAYLRNYTHCFVRFDERGKIIATSEHFQFRKAGVEFAAGIVEYKEKFLITYGVQDIAAFMLTIPKKTVLDSLEAVIYH